MRLSVLFSIDGRIVSVLRTASADAGDVSETPSPETAITSAGGERVAFFDIDPSWDRRPLAEIHQAFTVIDGTDGPYLHPREAAT